VNGEIDVPNIVHQLSLDENFAPPLSGVREAVTAAANQSHLTLDASPAHRSRDLVQRIHQCLARTRQRRRTILVQG
jgi:hypothetical protein